MTSKPRKSKHKMDKPGVRYKPKDFRHTSNVIRDKEGYAWSHVATVDKKEAERIELFYKRIKKEHKIVKDGNAYAVFVRRG